MDPENSDRLPEVKAAKLLDVSIVQDDGMKALLLLANSLGWNIHHKHNQPVVITSRAGIQRRLPTTTQVRASYFQSNLSAIVLHSTLEPTIELMESIIGIIKPNQDIARRLRLAVGESPQQHRERLMNAEIDPEELLMTPAETVVITWDEPPPVVEKVRSTNTHPSKAIGTDGPADGQGHGAVKSVEPFLAKAHIHGSKAMAYESESAKLRTWTDGYQDFVCTICGKAYRTSKGVGSHRQVHIRAGEAAPVDRGVRSHGDRLISIEPWEKGTRASSPRTPQPEPPVSDAEAVLDQIRSIVLGPQWDALKLRVLEYEEENEKLKAELAKLQADWDALRAILK